MCILLLRTIQSTNSLGCVSILCVWVYAFSALLRPRRIKCIVDTNHKKGHLKKCKAAIQRNIFSNFSCMFLNANNFFPIWIIIVLIYKIWENYRNKLKKHSVTKNCSDLSLFEQIVLVIPKFLQILVLQPRISKVFLDH